MGRNILRYISGTTPLNEVFGTPFYCSPFVPSGVLSIQSSTFREPANYVEDPILLFADGIDTLIGTTHCPILVPLFPTGTIPRKFELEFIGKTSGSFSAGSQNIFLAFGTPNPTSNNFHGWGIGLWNTEEIYSFNSSSTSIINTVDSPGVWMDPTFGIRIPDSLWMRVEQKTINPTSASDVRWRIEMATNNTDGNGSFEDHFLVDFTGSYTSSGWNGATLNKLYLGFYSTTFQRIGLIISSIRIRKHELELVNE